MRVFFDTSAFAKRCVKEAGTEHVLSWCERADELTLCVIAPPEMVSAVCRLRREGRSTPTQYRQIKQDLIADPGDARLCNITPTLLQFAVQALEAGTLRGMDAMHIAAAQAMEAEVFVAADARQCVAARASGLRVVEVQAKRRRPSAGNPCPTPSAMRSRPVAGAACGQCRCAYHPQALCAAAHGGCDTASVEGRQLPVMRAGQGQEVAVGDRRGRGQRCAARRFRSAGRWPRPCVCGRQSIRDLRHRERAPGRAARAAHSRRA